MIEENAPANPTIDDIIKSFEAAWKADEIIRKSEEEEKKQYINPPRMFKDVPLQKN